MTEVKILFLVFCLTLFVFLFIFAVGFPLVFEHRLISSRLSPGYVMNFFSGMIFYFFLTGLLSVAVYFFVKNINMEWRIFVIAYLAFFLGVLGGIPTSILYYGNRANPFWIILIWQALVDPDKPWWTLKYIMYFLFIASAIIGVISVGSYKAYKSLKKGI